MQEHADSVFAGARLVNEDELRRLLATPYTLRKGFYLPPDPHLDQDAAEQLKAEKQSLQEDRAGFLAVRWMKGEPTHPSVAASLRWAPGTPTPEASTRWGHRDPDTN